MLFSRKDAQPVPQAEQGTLTCFYLPYCPHCRLASRLLENLIRDEPKYANIPIRMVDESVERAYANSQPYYLVPSFFLGGKKLFEGHMEERDVRRVLDEALAQLADADARSERPGA